LVPRPSIKHRGQQGNNGAQVGEVVQKSQERETNGSQSEIRGNIKKEIPDRPAGSNLRRKEIPYKKKEKHIIMDGEGGGD